MATLTLDKQLTKERLKLLDKCLNLSRTKAISLNLTQVHGFICAILSAPHLITSKQWLSVLFAEKDAFKVSEQMEQIKHLLVQLNDQTSCQLNEDEEFNFMLWSEDRVVSLNECSFELLAQWCRGYLQGTQLDPLWYSDNKAVKMLLPFSTLADEYKIENAQDTTDNAEDNTQYKVKFKSNLLTYVKANYNYWKGLRATPMPLGWS